MIRVLSFNIRGGLGLDGRRDTRRIAETVRAHTPDIVCLQEVHQRLPWSGFVNQPALLEKTLEMRVIFQRNINTLVGGYGNVIASRFPVRRVRRHRLPSLGEQRGALEVSLETPAGPVSVWCTHWGLGGEERVRQAACLAGLLSAVPEAVIVCGDFNEWTEAPAVRRLRAQASLEDAGAETDRPTYPADTPTARIDFLLHTPGLHTKGVSVPETESSDHRPVIADFEK